MQDRTNEVSLHDLLPEEIWLAIFAYLPIQPLIRLRLISVDGKYLAESILIDFICNQLSELPREKAYTFITRFQQSAIYRELERKLIAHENMSAKEVICLVLTRRGTGLPLFELHLSLQTAMAAMNNLNEPTKTQLNIISTALLCSLPGETKPITELINILQSRQINHHSKPISLVNLAGVDFSNQNLSGIYLSGTILAHANLSGCDLSEAKLSFAYLHHANLNDAQLLDAQFKYSDLQYAQLVGALKKECSFSSANLTGITVLAPGKDLIAEVRRALDDVRGQMESYRLSIAVAQNIAIIIRHSEMDIEDKRELLSQAQLLFPTKWVTSGFFQIHTHCIRNKEAQTILNELNDELTILRLQASRRYI